MHIYIQTHWCFRK